MEDSFVGKQIREYEVLSVIGKGGMGAIYRARHIYLDEERAIKVIRPQFSASRDYLERFIREARILTRMRHPNLVLLYEFGTLEKNIFFMVLELINGRAFLKEFDVMVEFRLMKLSGLFEQLRLDCMQHINKELFIAIFHRTIF